MNRRIVSKTNQRISQSLIVESKNKKYFVKKYFDSYPKNLIKTEFEKSLKIYRLLDDRKKGVKTPQPLEFNLRKREIVFEYIPGLVEFKKIFFKKNNFLYQDKKGTSKILERVANTVAYLHDNLVLNKTKKIEWGLINQDLVPILADLSNANILLKEDTIYLIDFSPTQEIYSVETCNIVSHYYLDLVQLIFSYELPPIIQRAFYKVDFEHYEKAIIKSYLKARNILFNREDFIKAKILYLKKYLKVATENKMTGLLWERILEKKIRELEHEL